MSTQASARFAELYPEQAAQLRALEADLAALRAELEQYRQIFAAAVSGPVAQKILGSLGIRLPDVL